MSLLPIRRRFAPGGTLPGADQSELSQLSQTPPTDPVAHQRWLIARQNAQQSSAGSSTGSQVAGGIQQAGQLAAAVGGPGLAGVAGAAGPIGMAVAAGAAVGGALHKSNLEDDGLRNTSGAGQVKDAVGNMLDPLGSIASTWSNGKLNTGQKILSTLAPGAASFFTKGIVDAERKKQQRQLLDTAIDQGGRKSQQVYGALGGAQYQRGGLLPVVGTSRRFAGGGIAPAEPAGPPNGPGTNVPPNALHGKKTPVPRLSFTTKMRCLR